MPQWKDSFDLSASIEDCNHEKPVGNNKVCVMPTCQPITPKPLIFILLITYCFAKRMHLMKHSSFYDMTLLCTARIWFPNVHSLKVVRHGPRLKKTLTPRDKGTKHSFWKGLAVQPVQQRMHAKTPLHRLRSQSVSPDFNKVSQNEILCWYNKNCLDEPDIELYCYSPLFTAMKQRWFRKRAYKHLAVEPSSQQ